MANKKLLLLQTAVLIGGMVFAWSKLIPQFTKFHLAYGTFFRFRDCTVPNPLATACFYGSVAFLVAVIWSILVLQNPTKTSQRRLRNFLLFGVLFAGTVVFSEFAEYYKWFSTGGVSISCSPGVDPLKTPCFTGMLFFVGAYIVSIFATKQLSQSMYPY